MKKLCIFDFDGTIAETMENIAFFLNKTMKHFSLGEIDIETVNGFVGNGAKKLVERGLKYHNSSLPLDEVLEVYLNYYNSEPTYLVKIYDGIYELIETLKEKGTEVAILSNKPDSSTKLIVNHFFPEGTFIKCLGKSEEFKAKPDPEAPNHIAEGFEKENCFFIGDSDVDIATGKNAGMTSIACSWGFKTREFLLGHNPDYIVDSPLEILSIVLGDNA